LNDRSISLTADEKIVLARFLDRAGDYLRDGYARDRPDYTFGNDTPVLTEPPSGPNSPSEDFSSLPLAYQVDEDTEEKETLEDIAIAVEKCRACSLGATRTLSVPGEGVQNPRIMVIGEGPGADEDAAGRPFVGKAGQLLDRMLDSIGLSRDKNCYIANVVKCRPPGNRDPEPGEIAACFPYLEQQITLLAPRIILCVGRVASQSLLKTGKGINAMRGDFFEYKTGETVIPVLCTYHPSAILRDESLKRPAWEDLKLLKSRLLSLLDTGR